MVGKGSKSGTQLGVHQQRAEGKGMFLKIHLGHDLEHFWIFQNLKMKKNLLGSFLVACSSQCYWKNEN